MTLSAEQAWVLGQAGGQVRDFYAAIGVDLPNTGGAEAQVSCFANATAHKREDRDPSCSVNLMSGLWKCHGCGMSGNPFAAAVALGYSDRRAREFAQQYGLFLESAPKFDDTPAAPRLPDERKIRHWKGLLRCSVLPRSPVASHKDPEWTPEQIEMSRVLLARLWELKGWTPRAVVRCGLGWDGERIVFTIRDKKLQKAGVVRYLPGGSPKSKALPGSRRTLFPAPEVLLKRQPLFLVEGEPDAVSVRSVGLQACAIPGAGGWRQEYAQRLMGFRIVVLADCDRQGRELADRVAGSLPNVKVIDLEPARTDGTDIGDWIAQAAHEGGLRQVRRVLERVAA